MSLSSILAVIIGLRYERAIMLPKSSKEALNLLASSAVIAFLLSLLIFVLGFLSHRECTRIFNIYEIGYWFWLLAPTVFLLGVMNTIQIWWNRENEFRRTATSNVVRALTDNGVKIGIGLTSISGAFGLIMGFIGGVFMSVVHLISGFWPFNHSRCFQLLNKESIKSVLVKYRSFPLYNSWGSLLNVAALQAPVLLLTYFYGIKVVGLFALTNRVLRLPARFVGRSISQAFFKKFTDNLKNEVPIFPVISKVVAHLSLIAIVPLVTIVCFGELIFRYVFGVEWMDAGVYAKIMAGWIGMQFLSSAISPVFLGLGRNRFLAGLQGVLLLSSVSPILLASFLQKGSVGVITMLSASNFAAYSLYLLAAMVICQRHDRLLKI